MRFGLMLIFSHTYEVFAHMTSSNVSKLVPGALTDADKKKAHDAALAIFDGSKKIAKETAKIEAFRTGLSSHMFGLAQAAAHYAKGNLKAEVLRFTELCKEGESFIRARKSPDKENPLAVKVLMPSWPVFKAACMKNYEAELSCAAFETLGGWTSGRKAQEAENAAAAATNARTPIASEPGPNTATLQPATTEPVVPIGADLSNALKRVVEAAKGLSDSQRARLAKAIFEATRRIANEKVKPSQAAKDAAKTKDAKAETEAAPTAEQSAQDERMVANA